MAIADERLKQFFSKQKVGNFDALKQSPKAIIHENKPKDTILINTNSEEKEKKNKIIWDKVVSEDSYNPDHTDTTITEIKTQINTDISLSNKNSSLPNREQSVSKPLSEREQTVSAPLAFSKQDVSDPLSETLANPLAEKDKVHFSDLRNFSKKERELITLIFWQCHNNCSLDSPPIYTEEIINTLKVSSVRARNLIFRIVKKSGIEVLQHKSGQGAYRVFKLPKSLYQWMVDQQNRRNIVIEPLAQPLANSLANNLYSSNSLLNNKRTTTSLPEDWKKINFESLNSLGFSETQLKQLFETNVTTPEIVQYSINHFSYGLEHNEKVKGYKDPLNVFMGVLRKGQKWHEADYISPKELALRQLLDEKKKEKEKREAMLKEMTDIEFPNWRKKLTDNQIKLIVPESVLRMNVSSAITASLRTHFVEKILLPKLENMGLEE